MINLQELQTKLEAYGDEAKIFFHSFGVGDLVLDKPVDHAAIKALNKQEYDKYLTQFLPLSKRLSYEPVGPRQIAIAELSDPLTCGSFGEVLTLEIMEPKPGAAITTHDMIDHIELLVPDISEISKTLAEKGVEYKLQENPNHKSVVVEINEWGQEVKFTDRPLADIAEKHIAAGIALIHK